MPMKAACWEQARRVEGVFAMLWILLAVLLGVLGLVIAVLVGVDQLRQRNLHYWLPTYLRESGRRRDPRPDEDVHLILCIADHFEPRGANPRGQEATAMVQRWVREYPRQFAGF